MVDVGVGRRRVVVVLGHEAVGDTAGLAAAEGAGQSRGPWLAQRLAVRRCGPGLGGQHQRAADLGRGRAGAQDRGHAGAVDDPAGGDQRQVDLGRGQPQGDEQPEVLGVVVVVEVAAVAAGLEPLDDERVRAGVARLYGLRAGW